MGRVFCTVCVHRQIAHLVHSGSSGFRRVLKYRLRKLGRAVAATAGNLAAGAEYEEYGQNDERSVWRCSRLKRCCRQDRELYMFREKVKQGREMRCWRD